MRPPICAVCDERFFEGGGLVQFVLTPEDEERKKFIKENDYVGHPPALEWFCEKHIEKAQECSNMTLSDAMKIIREYYK